MKQHHLIEDCISVFLQGRQLLLEIGEEGNYESIGGHIRHCLDFVDCLLSGLPAGRIDYNKRSRDLLIERDRKAAADKIEETIAGLRGISASDIEKQVMIRHERAENPDSAGAWCSSSLARELEFMQSHTVHHYAIIKLKLEMQGISISEDLGVAASTLKYRAESA